MDTEAHDARSHQIELLERAFWQSIADNRPEVATGLLTEPAVLATSQGAITFDHDGYRQMAQSQEKDGQLASFELSDFNVSFPVEEVGIATYTAHHTVHVNHQDAKVATVHCSTWLRRGDSWTCAARTESMMKPVGA